jgi:hypothetical protein
MEAALKPESRPVPAATSALAPPWERDSGQRIVFDAVFDSALSLPAVS